MIHSSMMEEMIHLSAQTTYFRVMSYGVVQVTYSAVIC